MKNSDTHTPKIQFCCNNCFDTNKDRVFTKRLHKLEPQIGDCPCCGSEHTSLYKISDVEPIFADVLKSYEPLEDGTNFIKDLDYVNKARGMSLAERIQVDIGIFNKNVDIEKFNLLLDAIRGDSAITTPSSPEIWVHHENSFCHVSEAEIWDLFCNYIKHNRRFFIDWNLINIDPQELLNRINRQADLSKTLYRARIVNPNQNIGEDPISWNVEDMLPPINPPIGRCNPDGIAYLYLADSEVTALKEIHAKPGDYATIAKIKLEFKDSYLPNIKAERLPDFSFEIADFSKEIELISPFSSDARKENRILKLTNALNKYMGKPISENESRIEYIPTQIFTELARDMGFRGISFSSSQNIGGINYVIFPKGDELTVDSHTKKWSIYRFPIIIESMRLVKISDEIKFSYISNEISDTRYEIMKQLG